MALFVYSSLPNLYTPQTPNTNSAMNKCTQLALSYPHFKNLLPHWLQSLYRLGHETPTSESNPHNQPPLSSTEMPTEILELGQFLSHPSLQWHYVNKIVASAIASHTLLLVILPLHGRSYFFGPLATIDNKGISQAALKKLSAPQQHNIAQISMSTVSAILLTQNSHKLAEDPAKAPVYISRFDRTDPSHLFAIPTDPTLSLPSFCVQNIASTQHLLLPWAFRKSMDKSAPTELWQYEPSLDCADWRARVHLSLDISGKPLRSKCTLQIAYSHPELGELLPTAHRTFCEYKGYSPENFRVQLTRTAQVLKKNFEYLLDLKSAILQKTSPLFAAITQKATPTGFSLTMHPLLSTERKTPPVVILLTYESQDRPKTNAVSHYDPLTGENQMDYFQLHIICNSSLLPPESRKQTHTQPGRTPHSQLPAIVERYCQQLYDMHLALITC